MPVRGLRPVDRAALARLPAGTLLALAVGVDGDAAWDSAGEALLDLRAAAMAEPVGLLRDRINRDLAEAGIGLGLSELVRALSGTVIIAVTPGTPLPGISVLVPRTTGTTRLVEGLAGRAGMTVPPVGSLLAIPLPAQVPVPVTLAGDAGHWLLTTDPQFAERFIAGQPGGIERAPAAAEALRQAPADASIIGFSDTPALLRTLTALLPLDRRLPPAQRRLLSVLGERLAASASTGWLWSGVRGGGQAMELRGLTGTVALAPIVGLASGPALAAARRQREETAAMATLRTGVLPAQILFSEQGRRDRDGNGRGEFAVIGELAGDPIRGAAPGAGATAALLPAAFRGADPLVDGYRFRIYLPTGTASGTHLADAAIAAIGGTGVADLQENYFVAYAWPDRDPAGRRAFAITPSGRLFAMPAAATAAPAWNSLTGANGWSIVVPAASPWRPAPR